MRVDVVMPQMGESIAEGTITRWMKQIGDTVSRDEPLFEISTDKVDTEVPSPLAGTLVQIKVQEGETVSVGTELAMIDTGAEPAEDVAASTGAAAEAPEAPAEELSPEVPAASAEPTAEPSTPAAPAATAA
jgi:2-oxoglutarate dehydrogenase E2 component (dihydrolipoamide succinyltransferase)